MTTEKAIALINAVGVTMTKEEALAQVRASGSKVGRKPRLDTSVLQTALDAVLARGSFTATGAAQEVYLLVRPEHADAPGVAQITNLIKQGKLKGDIKHREKKVVPSVPSADTTPTVVTEETPAGEVVSVTPSDVATISEVTAKPKKSRTKATA